MVALFNLDVEMFIPFTGSSECGAPFDVMFFAFGVIVREQVAVDQRVTTERGRLWGEVEVLAPWPVRLLFESLIAISAGANSTSVPEPGDPNVCERYRLRHALPEPCHLSVLSGSLTVSPLPFPGSFRGGRDGD